MARTRIADQINEGAEHHDFGVTDAQGRKLGTKISFATVVYEDIAETVVSYAPYVREAGTYFTFTPHTTRDGKRFGALQDERHFTTEAARYEAVERYLAGARKRAGG